VSTGGQREKNPVTRLKPILGHVPRDGEFLTRYVTGIEHHRGEEEILRRLASKNANAGGSYGGDHRFIVSVFSGNV
jgi:hypothetical protein